MAKTKGGLGRGLSSLLGGAPEEETQETTEVVEKKETPKPIQTKKEEAPQEKEPMKVIEREARQTTPEPLNTVKTRTPSEVPVNAIIPNPDQPRTNFNKTELEELSESIKNEGMLQPIVVRALGENSYQIIAGERRWQAAKQAGVKNVPIKVIEADDNHALELALVENLQRANLNPIEEAYGYKRLMERKGLTQSELASTVSKGRSTIANALRLLDLPEEAQQLLFEEKITAGHARAILSVPSKEGKEKLTKKVTKEKLSVRETENIARLMSGKTKANTDGQQRVQIPSEFKKFARELKNTLQTQVKVKQKNGINKIEIEFQDLDDLERIFKGVFSGN